MRGNLDFQQIADFGPVVHYVAQATGDFPRVYVSAGIRRLLGYAPEEFTADPSFWASRIHSEDHARVLADLETMFGRERHVHEYRLQRADGDWRWVRDELMLVRDEDSQPARIIGTWLDVTELKAAEETLKQISGRLQESQRIAGIGSWEIDVAQSTGWWSDETFRIFGEEPSAYLPSQELFVAKIHPEDRPRFLKTVARAIEDGEPYSIDYRIVLSDGSEKIVNGRGHRLASDGGRPTRFAGTVQDVTDRENIAQALRETEARNRALLEANPDVILRVDAEGQYLDLAVAATTPFPYTKSDLIGSTVEDLFGREFAREHQWYVRKAIKTGRMQVWEHRISLPNIGEIDLESRFVGSGENEAVVTVRDVTERLALQRDVVAAQERERRLIGHDLHDGLGQELTGISLGLEALAKELGRERSAHARTVQNLRALAQNSISRAHRISVSLAPAFGNGLGVGRTLRALAGQVDGLANVKCSVHCSGEDHPHHIDVDANLYRIAQECLTNALKHGSASNIEFRYGCDGNTVRLEVLDDGVGIAPEGTRVEGMGMRGIRYRAQLVNGRLEIGQREIGGTRVSCACPCQR
jgi:PAS domain S-box-containing protein